jgi:tRNA-binding protein
MEPFRPAPVKAPISPELLEQLDVRVGTIIAVDEVTGSDKLMRLTVDLGDHTRTILAGIKQERANPQEIVGRQALVVVNLPPRKMRGIVSEGMRCSSTLATPTASRPCSPRRSQRCRTGPAPAERADAIDDQRTVHDERQARRPRGPQFPGRPSGRRSSTRCW